MKKSLLLLSLIFSFSFGYSQKAKIESGNFKELNGEKTVLLSFKYDNVAIGKKTEEQYLSEKIAEKNAKTPGSGDSFKEKWFNDRPQRMEPKFEELVNKYTNKKDLSLGREYKDSKYMFIINIKNMDPGFNVGVVRRPAYIDFEINLVEVSNPSKVIGVITVDNATGQDGMGFDFDAGYRYGESYAKCGKMVGKLLIDKALK